MKSINDLYQEVKNDEALRKKFLDACAKGEAEGFLKENECDATAEEALEFLKNEVRPDVGELSEEELAIVVGGLTKVKEDDKPTNPPKYEVGQEAYFFMYGGESGRYSSRILDIRARYGEWEYRVDSYTEYWTPENTISKAWW